MERRRGHLYSGILAVVLAAVVTVAGSALYLTAGGSLLGMGAGTFGLESGAPDTGGTLNRAREAAWSGRHHAAIAAYDSVLAARPMDREVAVERARVLSWAEDYSAAADALAALPAAPGDSAAADLAVQRARYLWWSGRAREADSLLSVIRTAHPDLAEAAELQALVRPSVEPALDVATRWVRERPLDPWSNLWLARALVHERRGGESLAHYRLALGEPGSLDPEILLEAAGVALGADSLGLAGQLLALYLRDIDPPDWETRLRLARAYSWSGRYTAAAGQYLIVLEQAPDDSVRLELGRMLASAGRYDAAAAQLSLLLAGQESVSLLLELARLRGLADRYADAAEVLGRVLELRPDDHGVRLDRARFLWWAGRLEAADAELDRVLTAEPGHAAARALRDQVRPGIDPSVDLARRWLAMEDNRENRLHLARALVQAERYGEALEHYDRVLADAADADLVIEAVDVADAAGAADQVLLFLERHADAVGTPAPRMILRLARAYAWADRNAEATTAYAIYLDARPDDVTARFERARQLAWSDSTMHAEAVSELERVVAAEPSHGEALRLLGDLARWSGDPEAALAFYRRAASIDPDLDHLDDGIRLALALRDAQVVPRDATQVSWAVELDAFTDTEGFDWVGSGIRREWRFGANALSVRLGQGYSRGRPQAGSEVGSLGLGAVLGGRVLVRPDLALLAELGTVAFGSLDPFVTWGAGMEYAPGSTQARLWYGRSPAVREAATMAALQAGAVLDLMQVAAAHDSGRWRVATDLQLQRFSADLGDATRYAGSLRVDRALGETGVAVGGMVRGVFAYDRAPYLPDWGRLYWTPDHYIAPALAVSYGAQIADGLWLGLRAAPGIAFIDEGDAGPARYDRGRTAILETGASVGYHRGPWRMELSGDWGGAVPDGYHASSLRFQLSRFGGPR
jgi:tetratricopeptide (TPR) repeat protein